jgi:hypothetical protein
LRGEWLQLLQLQPPNDVGVDGEESGGGQQDGGVGEGDRRDGRSLSPGVCNIVPLAYLSQMSERAGASGGVAMNRAAAARGDQAGGERGEYKERVLRVEGEFGQEKRKMTDRIGFFHKIGVRKRSECLAVVMGLEDGDDWPRRCGG